METSTLTTFSDLDIQNTQPAMKVGLLATVTPEGRPHVTLISSLMACSPMQLCFGQFTEGMSKHHILTNPNAGFLIMSLDKNLWRGKAKFNHSVQSGAEYDYYNNVPMFRYNAYFGVHTVYYLDLITHTGKLPLPMNRIIFAAVQTMVARTLGKKQGKQPVLNTWTRAFVDKIDNLKFLVDKAIQLHGAYGYMSEYEVERYYRDVRGWSMGGGTTQMPEPPCSGTVDMSRGSLLSLARSIAFRAASCH